MPVMTGRFNTMEPPRSTSNDNLISSHDLSDFGTGKKLTIHSSSPALSRMNRVINRQCTNMIGSGLFPFTLVHIDHNSL